MGSNDHAIDRDLRAGFGAASGNGGDQLETRLALATQRA
jgi:hypothetical protein